MLQVEALVRHLRPDLVMPLSLPAASTRAQLRDVLASFLATSEDLGSSGKNFEVPSSAVTKQISER